MKIALKIFKYFLLSVAIAIICVSTYIIVAKKIFKQEMPKVFGFASAIVATGSMSPTIEAGDVVFLKQLTQYGVNDIVVFKDGNSFTTHRIVEVVDDGFVTRGDANNTNDLEVLKQSNIHGKVVAVIPFIGKILSFFTSTAGIICIILVGVCFICADPIIKALKNKGGNDDIKDKEA